MEFTIKEATRYTFNTACPNFKLRTGINVIEPCACSNKYTEINCNSFITQNLLRINNQILKSEIQSKVQNESYLLKIILNIDINNKIKQ